MTSEQKWEHIQQMLGDAIGTARVYRDLFGGPQKVQLKAATRAMDKAASILASAQDERARADVELTQGEIELLAEVFPTLAPLGTGDPFNPEPDRVWIQRASEREFDLRLIGYGYIAWLPMAWLRLIFGSYFDELPLGGWSRVRELSREKKWTIFEEALKGYHF